MRVSLGRYPTPQRTYTVDFPKLTGGLNLWELDYRMSADQSPNMKNLWWQDGVLQCRDGQVYLTSDTGLGIGYTCYEALFWGHAFFHIGDRLYCADPTGKELALSQLCSGVPDNRGTFFRYMDWLYYKNKGGFYRIAYDGAGFSVTNVAQEPYVPVTIINAHPDYGSGDLYQPANRLTGKRTVQYNAVKDTTVYHLLADKVKSVDLVQVEGVTLIRGTDYTVNLEDGTVTFSAAPPVTDPATNNTVHITFTVENEDSFNAVMDCEYAMVSGGDTNLCILLGGCDAQPNGVFWNSNDSLAMNDSYFPDSYFNLVGDTEDPVTGFGRQYSDTIVFKAHGVGKLVFTVEDVDGRSTISFTYQSINSRVGCDLPWSIQLIENNLVFCNTYQGVHVVRSSSAAYENNVECISRNVNGREYQGLLWDVRSGGVVTSFDDDSRYWLCANGNVYLWDYVLSGHAQPSWFFFTDVAGVAFFRDDEHRTFHLDRKGRVTRFERTFCDYGGPIEKLYQFPAQYFGSYERLKDVTDIIITVRSDTDTDVTIRYDTDYGTRYDLTPIRTAPYYWRLAPRDLTKRCLSVARYAYVARRRPGCRHIRHFSMTFSNDVAGCDLAVVSARINYKFQGKER